MDAVKIERLLSKGAEADLYLGWYFGFRAVFKVRVEKKYRDPRFDRWIRRERTILEAKTIAVTHKIGIPTPALLDVNVENATLTLEYLEGELLRKVLDSSNVRETMYTLGSYAAKLHDNGICHGDLTTSNVILTPEGKLYLIDFGLSTRSRELEDFAVDVHLLMRSIESTHYEVVEEAVKAFKEGYESVLGRDFALKVLDRVREIRRRGRYVEERRLKSSVR